MISESFLGDDKSVNYLLFNMSYDGSLSRIYKITRTRVVCQNTLSLAMSELSPEVRVRNTKNSQSRLDERIATLENIRSSVAALDEKMEFLSERLLLEEPRENILSELFPLTSKKDDEGRTVLVSPTRRTNIINGILKRFEENDGNAFSSQRGTYYNFLNSITEFVDHDRTGKGSGKDSSKADEARAMSSMFGSGDVLKNRAFDLILKEAETAPLKGGNTSLVLIPEIV